MEYVLSGVYYPQTFSFVIFWETDAAGLNEGEGIFGVEGDGVVEEEGFGDGVWMIGVSSVF